MGGYASTPKKGKISEEGKEGSIRYAASGMQVTWKYQQNLKKGAQLPTEKQTVGFVCCFSTAVVRHNFLYCCLWGGLFFLVLAVARDHFNRAVCSTFVGGNHTQAELPWWISRTSSKVKFGIACTVSYVYRTLSTMGWATTTEVSIENSRLVTNLQMTDGRRAWGSARCIPWSTPSRLPTEAWDGVKFVIFLAQVEVYLWWASNWTVEGELFSRVTHDGVYFAHENLKTITTDNMHERLLDILFTPPVHIHTSV